MSFIDIAMHHTLHKTNNILSKLLLFSPNRWKSLLKQTGPGLMPEARRENYLNDRPRCPPTTDPGLVPEARRKTIWTITSYPPITGIGSTPEAQQGRYPHLANYYSLRVVTTKNYSDPFLLSTATTASGVRLSCLGWHLKPISDYLSTFLHFQNAAYLVKNQYKPITSFQDEHEV